MEDQSTNYFLAFILVFGLALGCGALSLVCMLLTGIVGLTLGG